MGIVNFSLRSTLACILSYFYCKIKHDLMCINNVRKTWINIHVKNPRVRKMISVARYRVLMSSSSSIKLLPSVGSFRPFCGLFSAPCGSFCCLLWAVYGSPCGWLASYVDCHCVCLCSRFLLSRLCGFLVHGEIFSNYGCLVVSGLGDSSHLERFLATPLAI